jgi:hypothetical protein
MKLAKINIFLLSVSVGIAIVFAVASISGIWTDNPSDAVAREAGEATLSTKTTGSLEDGDVEIQLTPRLSEGSRLVIKIGMDTHSVNLGQFDLAKITTLEYGGKTINPIKAKSPRGGHHSYGKIIFDVGEELNSFKIIIKGIPKVQERVYEWND